MNDHDEVSMPSISVFLTDEELAHRRRQSVRSLQRQRKAGKAPPSIRAGRRRLSRLDWVLAHEAGLEREADGTIRKSGGGVLVEGRAERREVEDLAAFAAILTKLRPNQALVYGVARETSVAVMSRTRFARAGQPDGVVTRTRDAFDWPAGPGVMMIDHDPAGDDRLTMEQLVELVRDAAPGLADVSMLWWPSASSCIHDVATGEELTGVRGQRLYLLVADASDIPRAGTALVNRLWAAGHGAVVPSASGMALMRCPIDASVWQPERLDFAAGADCGPGLEQRRGSPVPIEGKPIVDTRAALPDDPEIRAAAEAAREQAKRAAKPDLEAARDAYCEGRADAMLPPEHRGDPERREAAIWIARRAVENSVLAGDFPVDVEISPGRFETFAVGSILDQRERFHGLRTRDPLEPDYDCSRQKGKLFLLDARPTLFSFAHGGRSFRLIRAPFRIEVVQGRTVDATEQALRKLRDDPAIYDFGEHLAVAEQGKPQMMDEHALGHHLGGIVQFWRWRKSGRGPPRAEEIDPPTTVVRQVLSLGERRRLKRLSAVITAPTLRSDGSVLDKPGYDEKTQLLFDAGGVEPPPIPLTPSPWAAKRALDDLMEPFRFFPFSDPGASGACLAALLTASIRSALPTAPAFAIDAPVQGSGKTLLASAIAALATGRAPEIFDSAALAAQLTAPQFSDRILGKNESGSFPNRMLTLLTGNNLALAGDLARRVIVCRIDPRTDAPFARRFEVDPLQQVVRTRMHLVACALTLIRAAMSSDDPPAAGRMASFEHWDDLVRQTVCWVGRRLAPGAYGDPMDLVHTAQASDPEQEGLHALLDALRTLFGDRWFTARDVSSRANERFERTDAETALHESLVDLGGDRATRSTRSIGKVLSFRKDRIVHGLCLKARGGRNGNEFKTNPIRVWGRGKQTRQTRQTRRVSSPLA